MLCFVRQMSLTIFHLCDLNIWIVGMLPFLVGTLLRSLPVQFRQLFSCRCLNAAGFCQLPHSCSAKSSNFSPWLRFWSRCMNAGHWSFSRKQLVDDGAEGSQRLCSDEALPVDKECRRAGHTIAVGVLNVFGNFIGHLAAFDARVELCRVETADCLRHRGYGGEADSSDPLILKYRIVQSPIFIRSLLKGAVG